jgi:hypothetical protein
MGVSLDDALHHSCGQTEQYQLELPQQLLYELALGHLPLSRRHLNGGIEEVVLCDIQRYHYDRKNLIQQT